MGRLYAISEKGFALTAAADFLEITPATDKPVLLHSFYISQHTELADAAEEQLRIEVVRGHTTSGSGGATPTPRALNQDDAAAAFTTETRNTTIASTGTEHSLHVESWNIRQALVYMPTPECRPRGSGSTGRICVRLLAAPSDSVTFDFDALVEEL